MVYALTFFCFLFISCPTKWIALMVLITESGVAEAESILCSAKNLAKSGDRMDLARKCQLSLRILLLFVSIEQVVFLPLDFFHRINVLQ